MPSPNTDWGYDVSDYCDVHPELGTLDDFDELIREADKRGIRDPQRPRPEPHVRSAPVVQGRADVEGLADARLVRVGGSEAGRVASRTTGCPSSAGPAWTLDETTDQYYLHLFLPTQPDLNWWNDDVAKAFDEILQFWFDRGVAGFRLDVCHAVVKDRELRDNPPATEDDPPQIRGRGQRSIYDMNRPEVHDVLRRWRKIAKKYEPGAPARR